MKTPGQLFSFFVGLLLVNYGAYAAPMYYTFTGTITEFDDGAGIIADSYDTSTFIGRSIEYVFLVDLARAGEVTGFDGEKTIIADSTYEGISFDYFYVEGISGTLISEKDGGFYSIDNQPYAQADGRYGWNYTQLYPYHGYQGYMGFGSDNHYFTVGNYTGGEYINTHVYDWVIGQVVRGGEGALDSVGNRSDYHSSLTLTNISPVPVPAAAWLFGSALLGLAAVKCKKA